MVKRLIVIGGVVVVLALALVGYSVFRTPQAASGSMEAIPIAESTTAGATAAAADSAAVASGAAQVFEIVSAESEARFLIDEVLRGSPVTVVGTSSQVTGQIAIDPSNPAGAQVGTIQVNARALATDNDFRNRAIKNAILETDTYEFVSFTPTSISGLPTSVAAGEAFSFQMTGDLTVKDVTKTVTFDVTVTPVSATELTGTAVASVLYRDLGLTIPDSPSVDTVADEVRLELDFVARADAG